MLATGHSRLGLMSDLEHLSVSSLQSVPSPSISPSPPASSATDAVESPHKKTLDFFASPFSAPTTPPRNGTLPPVANNTEREISRRAEKAGQKRSLTEDFFGTSQKPSVNLPSSPSTSNTSAHTFQTSLVPPRQRHHLTLALTSDSTQTQFMHTSSPLSASFTSMPTPPLPSADSDADTPSESTPRPPDVKLNPSRIGRDLSHRKPSISQLEHSMHEDSDVDHGDSAIIFSPSPTAYSPTSASFTSHTRNGSVQSDISEDHLSPGMIIRSVLPSSVSRASSVRSTTSAISTSSSYGHSFSPPQSISASSSLSSNMSVPSGKGMKGSTVPQVPVCLTLNRPLGTGTFSSVWLAEDQSPTPLVLHSKRSLRDLRQRERAKDTASHGKNGDDKTLCVLEDTFARSHPPEATRFDGKVGTEVQLPTNVPLDQVKAKQKTLLPSASTIFRKLRGGVSGIRPAATQSSLPPSGTGKEDHSPTHAVGNNAASNPDIPTHKHPLYQRVYGDTLGLGLPSDTQSREHERASSSASVRSVYLTEKDGPGAGYPGGGGVSRASSISWSTAPSRNPSTRSSVGWKGRSSKRPRLVAVKLISRGAVEDLPEAEDVESKKPWEVERDRIRREEDEERKRKERNMTRVGFVREVEILKHISHPNITPLLSHLTTPTHHILVLPYLPGGDLQGLVNDNYSWLHLDEATVKRIFIELCRAVGWMHGVNLVHRDIKLDNIVLTTPLFAPASRSSSPQLQQDPEDPHHSVQNVRPNLPSPSHPLIKLADFGLSRFIDPASPLLTTRCGSEPYAAPELVISSGRDGNGGYDARETDAWACGVVLYATLGRRLPFGEGPQAINIGTNGDPLLSGSERRKWLMKIAIGEWTWPKESELIGTLDMQTFESNVLVDGTLRGPTLLRSNGARRVAERLLVRDPSRRAKIADLWDDTWMRLDEDVESSTSERHHRSEAQGSPVDVSTKPVRQYFNRSLTSWYQSQGNRNQRETLPGLGMNFRASEPSLPANVTDSGDGSTEDAHGTSEEGDYFSHSEESDIDENDHVGDEGWLVDAGGIDNIARQEVPLP